MEQPTTTKEIGKYRIKIYPDDMTESPRNDDNLGKMICFHRRYDLGDKHDYKRDSFRFVEDLKKTIIKNENVAVILPLYLYDHSGITISTTPFSCRFDSGQVGWVVVSKEKLREEYSVKRLTKAIIEKATKVLEGEVETYDQYLTGDVYRFKIVEVSTCDKGHEHEEVVDSCGGFYGEDECISEAESVVQHYLKEEAV